jgi:DNA-directed RNA polymerase subunit RPC12/RpoP
MKVAAQGYCPSCNTRIAGSIEQGSLNVCQKCGQIILLDSKFNFRAVPDDMLSYVPAPARDQVLKLRAKVRGSIQ